MHQECVWCWCPARESVPVVPVPQVLRLRPELPVAGLRTVVQVSGPVVVQPVLKPQQELAALAQAAEPPVPGHSMESGPEPLAASEAYSLSAAVAWLPELVEPAVLGNQA